MVGIQYCLFYIWIPLCVVYGIILSVLWLLDFPCSHSHRVYLYIQTLFIHDAEVALLSYCYRHHVQITYYGKRDRTMHGIKTLMTRCSIFMQRLDACQLQVKCHKKTFGKIKTLNAVLSWAVVHLRGVICMIICSKSSVDLDCCAMLTWCQEQIASLSNNLRLDIE